METKEIEGIVYVPKTAVEEIIKTRLGKMAKRATSAEERAASLEAKLQEASTAQTTADLLTQQITDLQSKLQTVEANYSRSKTMYSSGVTDPEIQEAILWAYDKQSPETTLGDWLQGAIADPSSAPVILRPHLQSLSAGKIPPPENPSSADTSSPPSADTSSPPSAPAVNTGALPAPARASSSLSAILSSTAAYAEHREQIRQAWADRRKR